MQSIVRVWSQPGRGFFMFNGVPDKIFGFVAEVNELLRRSRRFKELGPRTAFI